MDCSTCAHVELVISDLESEGLFLQCRRFPPQVMVVDEEVFNVWPTVERGDRCGEWRASIA